MKTWVWNWKTDAAFLQMDQPEKFLSPTHQDITMKGFVGTKPDGTRMSG